MNGNTFEKTTASVAAWNLSTFDPLSDERIEKQAKGLALLDAELITLVEIKNLDHLVKLKAHLEESGVRYDFHMLEQNSPGDGRNPMNIGVLYKRGVEVTEAFLMEGSDLGNPNYRRAYVCNVKIHKFDFKLIGVHLKSSRDSNSQKIRDEQCKAVSYTHLTLPTKA